MQAPEGMVVPHRQRGVGYPVRELEAVSLRDAAATLHIHPDTLRRLIKSGELRAFRASSYLRIRKSELDRFMQEQEQKEMGDTR